MDRIEQACAYLDIQEGQVISYKQYDEEKQFVLVYDRGILGCPKVIIPFEVLDANEATEVEAKKVDALKHKYVKPEPEEIQAPKPRTRKTRTSKAGGK